MTSKELKDFLDEKTEYYNHPDFIELDPVSIPHRYTRKEDIEISGFLSATIAWGQRKTIVKNAMQLMHLMDDAPFEFITNFGESELERFSGFVHRTFNSDDCRFFLQSLQNIYRHHNGLEYAFAYGLSGEKKGMADAINGFRKLFFHMHHQQRTEKHVSNPSANAAAKRLNMFLRWMVRKDRKGVDFGIWNSITPAQLSLPLDVHTGTVARKLGLLTRKQNDWKAVEEVTSRLRNFDVNDPAKYDFALFGLGIIEKF
ncbi:MAG: TIGR02757 family protein [Bacteroidales bacterium]|nr:TIGR02757 family protein [Bacteroidales bacterium]